MEARVFKTFAPLFPGFYGSHFEYDNEESDIQSYNEENNTDLSYDDFNWDYAEYHLRVAQAFTNRLETELKQFLPLSIKFENIYSPREYNFSNDSINIEVTLDLKQLIGLIKERADEAAKYFRQKYTSASGFISFHSNRLSDWTDEDYILEREDHRVGALLDCLASIEIDRDDIIYWADSENWINMEPKESVTDEA